MEVHLGLFFKILMMIRELSSDQYVLFLLEFLANISHQCIRLAQNIIRVKCRVFNDPFPFFSFALNVINLCQYSKAGHRCYHFIHVSSVLIILWYFIDHCCVFCKQFYMLILIGGFCLLNQCLDVLKKFLIPEPWLFFYVAKEDCHLALRVEIWENF